MILLQQLNDLINPEPDLVIVRELGELQGLLCRVLELLLNDSRPLQRRLRAVIGDVTIDDRDLFSEASGTAYPKARLLRSDSSQGSARRASRPRCLQSVRHAEAQ